MGKEQIVRLRGHHLISYFGYVVYRDKGWGTDPIKDAADLYGEKFVEAKRKTYGQLYDNCEETLVEIVEDLDDLCQRGCQRKDGICHEAKSREIDVRVAEVHGFRTGEIYPAKDLINACRKKTLWGTNPHNPLTPINFGRNRIEFE